MLLRLLEHYIIFVVLYQEVEGQFMYVLHDVRLKF